MPSTYLFLFGIAILTSQLVLIVSAAQNTCVEAKASFEDGFCKGFSVRTKFCEESKSKDDTKKQVENTIAGSGSEFSQIDCDNHYAGINRVVADGCKFMVWDSVYTPLTCDKNEYCGKVVPSIYSRSSTCSSHSQCPASSSGNGPPMCCDVFKRALQSQCSKQNEVELDMYVHDNARTLGLCKDTNCYGTGSIVRVARFTILISAMVALSMAYVF